MKKKLILFLITFCSFAAFAQNTTDTTKKHNILTETGAYYGFSKNFSFPAFRSYFYREHFFCSVRYGYDLSGVLLANVGYSFQHEGKNYFEVTPTFGLLGDMMYGYSPGTDIIFDSKYIHINCFNQAMFDCKNNQNLNNIYDWSEIYFNAITYFKPGVTLFNQYSWNTNTYIFDKAITVFSTFGKVNVYTYFFNFWNDYRWFFMGLSYKFSSTK